MHYCTLHGRWYDDYCTACFEEQQPNWDFHINPKQEEVDQRQLDSLHSPFHRQAEGGLRGLTGRLSSSDLSLQDIPLTELGRQVRSAFYRGPPDSTNYLLQSRKAYENQADYAALETRVLAQLAAQGITGIIRVGDSITFESEEAAQAYQKAMREEGAV